MTRVLKRGAAPWRCHVPAQFFVNNKRYALALGALGLPDNYYIDAQGRPAVPGIRGLETRAARGQLLA